MCFKLVNENSFFPINMSKNSFSCTSARFSTIFKIDDCEIVFLTLYYHCPQKSFLPPYRYIKDGRCSNCVRLDMKKDCSA